MEIQQPWATSHNSCLYELRMACGIQVAYRNRKIFDPYTKWTSNAWASKHMRPLLSLSHKWMGLIKVKLRILFLLAFTTPTTFILIIIFASSTNIYKYWRDDAKRNHSEFKLCEIWWIRKKMKCLPWHEIPTAINTQNEYLTFCVACS